MVTQSIVPSDLPDELIDLSLNVLTIFLSTVEIYSSPDSCYC